MQALNCNLKIIFFSSSTALTLDINFKNKIRLANIHFIIEFKGNLSSLTLPVEIVPV